MNLESGESGGGASGGGDLADSQPPDALRVLVVDDNIDAANSLAMLLSLTDGHDVRVAYDGVSAIQAAERHRPEVLLLDLGLPGLSGFEVARHLRGHGGFTRTLIVAITGWGMERDRTRSRESGFDAHLVKPVEPDMIREIVRQHRIDRRDPASPPLPSESGQEG